MSARFETFPWENNQFGWRLVAGNGEVVADGEGYDSRSNAERGIRDMVSTVLLAMDRDILVIEEKDA